MAATRDIFAGSPEKLAAKVVVFAEKDGPTWLKYSEEKKVTKASLDKEEVLKRVELGTAMHELQGNMSFPENTALKAMRIVVEKFKKNVEHDGFGSRRLRHHDDEQVPQLRLYCKQGEARHTLG